MDLSKTSTCELYEMLQNLYGVRARFKCGLDTRIRNDLTSKISQVGEEIHARKSGRSTLARIKLKRVRADQN